MDQAYDALIVVSFGGPERPEDVMPFLERVTQGRARPERLAEVAGHYHHFGGRSPINDQNRALVEALGAELEAHGPKLPVYWGNRNWHPFLADTLREMDAAGVRRALAFVTSAFGSYAGCRLYSEDIARARAETGTAMQVDKLRTFHDHPGFVEPMAERVREARAELGPDAPVVYTAHSVPVAMTAGSPYVGQLEETCRLVSERAGAVVWDLVWQSRSGPPQVPWLEPDVRAHLRALRERGVREVVVVPIGFVSDHVEVLYDLDVEAGQLAEELGMRMARARTVGTHPRFVRMIRELILERTAGAEPHALGSGPSPHVCPPDCCAFRASAA